MFEDNYELSFVKNGEIVRFKSDSLDEIKIINEFLVSINFNLKQIKTQNKFISNDVTYIIQYTKGNLRIAEKIYLNEPIMENNMMDKIMPQMSFDKFQNKGEEIKPDLDDKNIIKLSSYVKASSYRRAIVFQLHNSVKTPKELSLNSNFIQNNVSKTLADLKKRDIVVCINEESRKGRLYTLTEIGEEIYFNIFTVPDYDY